MMRPDSPGVRVDVTLLDFCGREIEMAAAESDEPRLQSTRESITYDLVIASRDHHETRRRGHGGLIRFRRAAEPFGATATPFPDEVGALESVFTR